MRVFLSFLLGDNEAKVTYEQHFVPKISKKKKQRNN